MKLKLDDEGNAVLKDGNPVYIHEDGSEHPFDAARTVQTISARNAEAKANRERYEAAEGKLKAFESIEDPEAALKALETVSKLDQKSLVDAGKVDEVRAEINKAWEKKLSDSEQHAKTLEQQLVDLTVGGAFSRSEYISKKTVLPADLAQAAFGKHFKVGEDGKLKALDANGNAIFSRKSPGEPADFDEAMEILVDQYPRKDSILRADNGSGSGAPAGNSGGPGQGKSIDRASFGRLDPQAQMKHIQDGGKVTEAA